MNKIIDVLYLFLPAIIALGIITSYEDLKYGKIRNKYIIIALIYALIVNLGFIMYLEIMGGEINYYYVGELISSILLSLMLGFFIWYSRFWTAGDAKLYISYTALMPLSVYNFGYIKYMPSLTILINTFIPLSLLYSVKILSKTSFKAKKVVFKEIFRIKSFFTYLIFIFVILWIPKLLVYHLNIEISFIEVMVIVLLFSSFLRILFKKNILIILIIICILRLVLDRSIYSSQFLKEFALFLLILIVFKTFFVELGKIVFSEKVKVKNLKKGMVLLDKIYKDKSNYKIERKNVSEKRMRTKNTPKQRNYVFKQTGDGLTKQDIKKIKKLYTQKKLNFSNLSINKITPFAHYMFIGVLITLFFRGNFLSTLSSLDYFIKEFIGTLPTLTVTIVIISLITILIYNYIPKHNKS